MSRGHLRVDLPHAFLRHQEVGQAGHGPDVPSRLATVGGGKVRRFLGVDISRRMFARMVSNYAACLLSLVVAYSANAVPIYMAPVVTDPASGFPLRLSLLSTDTDQGPLLFRLEPVSGAWDNVNHNGFYHFNPHSIDSIVGGSTVFVRLALGVGSMGAFNSLHLGGGVIDQTQPAYVDFVAFTEPSLPFVFDITHSANLVPGGPHAFARAVLVPEPASITFLAAGLAALGVGRQRWKPNRVVHKAPRNVCG